MFSRPKDKPTADAPARVAVAQSCVTTMRQSRRLVGLRRRIYQNETGTLAPLSEAERTQTMQGQLTMQAGKVAGESQT